MGCLRVTVRKGPGPAPSQPLRSHGSPVFRHQEAPSTTWGSVPSLAALPAPHHFPSEKSALSLFHSEPACRVTTFGIMQTIVINKSQASKSDQVENEPNSAACCVARVPGPAELTRSHLEFVLSGPGASRPPDRAWEEQLDSASRARRGEKEKGASFQKSLLLPDAISPLEIHSFG